MTDPDNNQQQPEGSTRKIYMNRMVQGVKVKWEFVVDADFTIIQEGPVDLSRPVITTTNPQSDMAANNNRLALYKKDLDQRGIKYDVTTDGQIIINEVPAREKHIMQFFDFNAPCPDIPGLQSVRDSYRSEYDQAGGAACPACQLNTIQRKYRQLLSQKFFNEQ